MCKEYLNVNSEWLQLVKRKNNLVTMSFSFNTAHTFVLLRNGQRWEGMNRTHIVGYTYYISVECHFVLK